MNKLYFLFFFFCFISCTIEKKSDSSEPGILTPKSGLEIYSERCTSCHGSDGKLEFGGAKDLTISKKSLNDVIHQVTNGKGAMAPYKNILSVDEINAVSKFAISLQLH